MKPFFLIKCIVLSLACLAAGSIVAQRRDCGTRTPETGLIRLPESYRVPMNQPFIIDIYVHIFANDNGTNRAITDSMLITRLEFMQSSYAPHDICFNLNGIRQINNSDLNLHDADNEEGELNQFLIPDRINIFMHQVLFDNDGNLNGIAYGIPNTYLSLDGVAISDENNISTTAHEMGHCLGLYHTFETIEADELVRRIIPCSNCLDSGDLLCDTEADPHSDTYDTGQVIDEDCNYTGSVTDACDNTYMMDPRNIMAYGRRICREIFTEDQGARMRGFLTLDQDLGDCLGSDNISFDPNQSQTFSSGWALFSAADPFTVQGNVFTVNGTARGHFTSSAVQVNDRVHFDPGTNGYVHIRPIALCD